MLVLPADHLIRDVAGFHEAPAKSGDVAGAGPLVTSASSAREPEPVMATSSAEKPSPHKKRLPGCAVVEKPGRSHAREFIARGAFYWNSGMFVFRRLGAPEELGKYRPDILKPAKEAWSRKHRDLDFVPWTRPLFLPRPADRSTYAVMVNTASPLWSRRHRLDDIGSWTALGSGIAGRGRQRHARRRARRHVRNCYVRAEDGGCGRFGVEDLTSSKPRTRCWFTHKDCSQDVKKVVGNAQIKAARRIPGAQARLPARGASTKALDNRRALFRSSASMVKTRIEALPCRCIITARSTGWWCHGTARIVPR